MQREGKAGVEMGQGSCLHALCVRALATKLYVHFVPLVLYVSTREGDFGVACALLTFLSNIHKQADTCETLVTH